ncbi:NAC domain-containing protein 35-like [Chenopodium quinoa]|uniref:NAC domain-containing protein 35-like n=1 Tax=Chenopodium quinoa TaxID=63459 RepID=UPI000B76B9DA|nr:NAC domain-containing protein 35-like [Chenopodium quinoa]
MATATTMNLTNVDINSSNHNNSNNVGNNNDKQQQDDQQQGDDEHEHDMVMPGFRFHPTEEELVEFYLRRKVEGKKFNVELITFLDLYRYDPWELPALAAIGEKEWFFYVPRDRKYRNGDRPNRVTTSGYWKATGADRMIRGENSRPIGLKKTLVFYSGKAPKGIRTSWIMNEYRLPQHETERYQKAEISLCRVYKRPGVEDHPSVPRGSSLPSRLSSSSKATSSSSERKNYHNAFRAQTTCLQQQIEHPPPQMGDKVSETDASSSTEVGTALGLSHHSSYSAVSPLVAPQQAITPPPPQPPTPSSIEVNRMMQLLNDHNPNLKHHHHHQVVVGGGEGGHGVITSLPSSLNTSITHHNHPTPGLVHPKHHHQPSLEDIHRLVEYQQACINHHFQQQQQPPPQQPQQQQHQFQFEALNNDNNPSSSNSTTNNLPFLFSNYLFSPAAQQAQAALVNNNPPTAAVGGGSSSSSLQLPPVTVAGAGGGLAFSERSLWDWNPYSEPNRDHFSNLFK